MKIHELGHIVFFVSNLQKSADFYKDILGFREIDRTDRTAVFSTGRTHHEMLLIEVGGKADFDKRPKPGLYHVGFKIGNSPEDIKNAYQELKEKEVVIVGTGDHTVTHSIYILDPDGNELELYADVSDSWKDDHHAIMTPVKHLNLDI
ncbi:VOC family protein [Patescibacteria group bacterium]|nr:VOC family protein [Patescibacteria group bacterium]